LAINTKKELKKSAHSTSRSIKLHFLTKEIFNPVDIVLVIGIFKKLTCSRSDKEECEAGDQLHLECLIIHICAGR